MSSIRLLTMRYSDDYTPTYLATLYQDNRAFEYFNFTTTPVRNHLISAVLTQGINLGGTLEISLQKGDFSGYTQMLSRYDTLIEVESPYIAMGEYTYTAPTNRKWRGMRARTIELPDRYNITYEGELSWLSAMYITAYSTSSMGNQGFMQYIVDRYNSNASQYNLDWETDVGAVDQGADYVRSATSPSTLWSEFKKGCLDKSINHAYVKDYSGSNLQRCLRFQKLPSVVNTYKKIISTDIITARHTVNATGRFKSFTAYGTNVFGYYSPVNNDVRDISRGFSLHPEVTDSTEINTIAQTEYEQKMLDSDGVELTLKPETGEDLSLGDIYSISSPKVGISGEYRLQKRTIDLMNPSKNKYTFGSASREITTR